MIQSLTTFSHKKALNGATIALDSGGGEKHYVYNFQEDPELRNSSYPYSAVVDGITRLYNADGECSDENPAHKLKLVETTFDDAFDKNKGTTITRSVGADEVEFNISSLQPREQIALAALQGMLIGIDNPLMLDNSRLELLADKAFKIAQSMINHAADNRATTTKSVPSQGEGGSAQAPAVRRIVEDEQGSSSDESLAKINKALRLAFNYIETETIDEEEVETEKGIVEVHLEAAKTLEDTKKTLDKLQKALVTTTTTGEGEEAVTTEESIAAIQKDANEKLDVLNTRLSTIATSLNALTAQLAAGIKVTITNPAEEQQPQEDTQTEEANSNPA